MARQRFSGRGAGGRDASRRGSAGVSDSEGSAAASSLSPSAIGKKSKRKRKEGKEHRQKKEKRRKEVREQEKTLMDTERFGSAAALQKAQMATGKAFIPLSGGSLSAGMGSTCADDDEFDLEKKASKKSKKRKA